MKGPSSRQPSTRFLTAQSLFLEVNAKRDQRLQSFQAKPQHDKSYALQLSKELEADLSFYCEAQREVDRLLDLVQELKLKLLLQGMEVKLERSIVSDFIKVRELDLELTEFFIEQLKPRLLNATAQAA